jgi:hypothetical protein
MTTGDTASEAAFEKAVSWFHECVTSHDKCGRLESAPVLPTRVLDVSGGRVRLVSPQGLQARYLCLSHRWGPNTASTTRANVEEYHESIPWDVLSSTYQDAITFARRFSEWHDAKHGEPVCHLWIDSLCIIQDSVADWKEQSQQMCDVYSNSSLTLVESYSDGVGEKRLFSKQSARYVPSSVPVTDADGRTHNFYYRNSILHPDTQVNSGQLPIWTRAWVLQERLLSPHLLIFGSEELSWQCTTARCCECGADQLSVESWKRMTAWKDSFKVRSPAATSRQKLDVALGKDPGAADHRRAWRLVAESYSQLELTYRSDTLPAMAGLAQSFKKQLGNVEYFGGMWWKRPDAEATASELARMNSDSLLDLLWRLEYIKDARTPRLEAPAVPVSWCWPSAQCPIIYPFLEDEVLVQYGVFLRVQGAQHVERLPEDHEAPRNWINDMYLEVPSTALTLAGHLWKTRLARTSASFLISKTEQREYSYHLGAMSDRIWQDRAMGRPVEVDLNIVQPPDDPTFESMPPIVIYPDSFTTEINGPIFCMAVAKFRHAPAKKGIAEKIIMAALVLEAVGHVANSEGHDPNLEAKEPDELVYRRLGLAYTSYGGWEEEHDEIIKKRPITMIRLVY